jgi:hypothetical protein
MRTDLYFNYVLIAFSNSRLCHQKSGLVSVREISLARNAYKWRLW